MSKHNDYMFGPHDFWTHFVCGFIFGALTGAILGWTLFENVWAMAASGLGLALFFGLVCGKWGDTSWSAIVECLCTCFWDLW